MLQNLVKFVPMKISPLDLIEKVHVLSTENHILKYRAWEKLNVQDFPEFTQVGILDVENPCPRAYQSAISYWSPMYPIALNYYPNSGSEIFFDGQAYYLVYVELGGHLPERRCRRVEASLII